jgi:endonuclease YncB( thermonuclease family)
LSNTVTARKIVKHYLKTLYAAAFIVVFLTVLADLLHASAGNVGVKAVDAEVLRVVDGDTVIVRMPDGKKTKVRLYGVDCPEKKQAFGKKATEFVRHLLGTEKLIVMPAETKTDKYGRTVGIVRLASGVTLEEELLIAGLAWVAFCDRPDCVAWKNFEKTARAEKRGLWVGDAPVPPWEWRKSRKAGHK